MTRKIQVLLAVLVVLGLGAGGYSLMAQDPARSDRFTRAASSSFAEDGAAREGSYGARIDALAAELAREREARQSLAAEVESLRGELARVRRAGSARTTLVAKADSPKHDGPEADGEKRQRPRSLDVDALVAAGFPEATVREFKASMDQMELDRLYLRDIAAREGWLDTPRFREESEALRLDMGSTREEYGEEFYDWMLYTTGHPNRVEVGDVMTGSAAEDVGLRPGDVVVSYDDARIFSPSELRDATIAGEVGALTPVEVLRNGRSMRLMVPRGPLGIRVDHATIEPQRAS